jgi:hypothetical protein
VPAHVLHRCIQLVLCQLPTLHHLRHLNIFATVVSLAFAGLVSVYCFVEGACSDQDTCTVDEPAPAANLHPDRVAAARPTCCTRQVLRAARCGGGKISCHHVLLYQHAYCMHFRRCTNRMPMCPVQAQGRQPCSPSATM